jgi:hypothetical protein
VSEELNTRHLRHTLIGHDDGEGSSGP